MRWGLFQRRTVWLPTWRGWLAFLGAGLGLTLLFLCRTYPFLAVNQPLPTDVMVLESWVSDDILELAVQEFRHGHYRLLLATGSKVQQGKYTLPFETYPEMTVAALKKLGLSDRQAIAVPAPTVQKDRTYHSALALRAWLTENEKDLKSLNVVTHACHARRTRLLFEKAIPGQPAIGVIAFDGVEYNAGNWWRCSAGVRDAVGELVAYAYARLLFRPGNEVGGR